jgi:predicted nucleic acid-binding protein
VIYLDTSALVKLVFEEPESAALASWLDEEPDVPKMSSEVSTIELIRTCRQRDEGALPGARQVLAGLDMLPMRSDVVEGAALARPVELRGLQAVHLASALTVAEVLRYFVVYDARLHSAAEGAGLRVHAPA